MTINILGSNFLRSQIINGNADTSIGYTNSSSREDARRRASSDGALYRMDNGHAGDSFTFSSDNGNAIIAADAGDQVTLKGDWKADPANKWVQDAKTGYWGKLYTNNKHETVLITNQDTKVKFDKSNLAEGIQA